MFSRATYIEKTILLTASLAMALILLATTKIQAADLNSKNDLCTGSNLTIQDNAGCSKVKDPSTGKFVDAKPAETPGSKANKLVKDIINLISIITGVASVIMIIYGGFRILSSAGNPESTKTGRNAILYALLGLIIVAFAQTIVKLVLSKSV